MKNRKQTNNLDKPNREYKVKVNITMQRSRRNKKTNEKFGNPSKCTRFHLRRMARVAIRRLSPLCLPPYPAFRALEILLWLPLSSRLVAFPISTFQVVGRLILYVAFCANFHLVVPKSPFLHFLISGCIHLRNTWVIFQQEWWVKLTGILICL
jgi:hypothetical protein